MSDNYKKFFAYQVFNVLVECFLTWHRSVKKRYYYGDKLDYECKDGSEGVVEVICTSNGTWSNIPMCSMSASPNTSCSVTMSSQQGECRKISIDYQLV